jgi:hypothetical protein
MLIKSTLELRVWNGMLLLWETHPLEKVRSLFGIEGVGVIGSERTLSLPAVSTSRVLVVVYRASMQHLLGGRSNDIEQGGRLLEI